MRRAIGHIILQYLFELIYISKHKVSCDTLLTHFSPQRHRNKLPDTPDREIGGEKIREFGEGCLLRVSDSF